MVATFSLSSLKLSKGKRLDLANLDSSQRQLLALQVVSQPPLVAAEDDLFLQIVKIRKSVFANCQDKKISFEECWKCLDIKYSMCSVQTVINF